MPAKPFEPHKLLTKRHYRAKEGIKGLAITVFWQAISRYRGAARRAIGPVSCRKVPPAGSAGYHLARADTALRWGARARNACLDTVIHLMCQGSFSLMVFRSFSPDRLAARGVPPSSLGC